MLIQKIKASTKDTIVVNMKTCAYDDKTAVLGDKLIIYMIFYMHISAYI
jgi:hypothetical protein